MGSINTDQHLRTTQNGLLISRPQRCLLLLQRSLAIRLQKISNLTSSSYESASSRTGHEYWMYDSGYRLFQSFLDANQKCFWNPSLLEAMSQLQFQGYVSPGVLLVSSDACALEIIRASWGRKTLQPPSNYMITLVGDVEECLVQSLPQSQFTPLPEALCWVVFELTSAGQPASLDAVRKALQRSFPVSEPPSQHTVYDALAKLMQERKIYQTSRGYFVVTPESRRRRSNSRGRSSSRGPYSPLLSICDGDDFSSIHDLSNNKTVLMSTDEALTYIHGEMETIRDGDITHQSIQTNLADVICGGNPNDKILYARVRLSSPANRLLERRHSLRLFGSKKRLSQSQSLPRCGSMRLSPLRQLDLGDIEVKPQVEKSPSLLSRIFRRSSSRSKKRNNNGGDSSSSSDPSLSTFSAQFPPAEWFNQSVVHLHSVATQTKSSSYSLASTRQSRDPLARSQGSLPWSDDIPSRASTLPRRRRHLSGETNFTLPNSAGSVSYANTPRSSRKSVPSSTGTLPRASSRTRSSSSSGSKLTGSPATSVIEASPLRKPITSIRQPSATTPMFTLQVSSRTSPPSFSSNKTEITTATTATITNGNINNNNGNSSSSSTRVCVLQSPNRSVVTLNGNPVLPTTTTTTQQQRMESPRRTVNSRPSSLYSPRDKKPIIPSSIPPPSTIQTPSTIKKEEIKQQSIPLKTTPTSNGLTNIKKYPSVENLIINKENNKIQNNIINNDQKSMNNIIGRKNSETLNSLKNLLFTSSSNTELDIIDKPSLKTSDSLNLIENVGKVLMQQQLNDDDDLDKSLHSSYPSLSDLTVNFKSLAAQKILKGISINSIDTLVEVNMAAAASATNNNNNQIIEKQNNYDVTLHTDFGLV